MTQGSGKGEGGKGATSTVAPFPFPSFAGPVRRSRSPLLQRINVDDRLGEIRELLVRVPFLFQRPLQEISVLGEAEHVGVGAGAAIAGHLVMLNALRGGAQRGVENVGVGELLHDFVALLHQSFNSLALMTAQFLAEVLTDLFEPLLLLLGLLIMLLERLL